MSESIKRCLSESNCKAQDEVAAKRQCLCSEPITKIGVLDLSGGRFDISVHDGEDRVADIKQKINEEHGYNVKEMQLVLGRDVLENDIVLSNTPFKHGDNLTLIMKLGTSEMHVESIYDDTQWHGKHKFALRSDPLQHEVEKIDVSVGDFRDQGWGGCQARLFIYLHDPADEDAVVASKLIFGPLRTSQYDERKHRSSPSCTITEEEPVVHLAKPGMIYKLRYQCGGGGGHSITVKNWLCKLFPKGWATDEVTTKVSGTVNLRHKNRLGPDETTGKWELAEPV